LSKKRDLTMDGLRKCYRTTAIIIVVLLLCSPVFSQTEKIEDDVCLTCHEDYNIGLSFTTHRLSSEVTKPNIEIGCTSCHSGGEIHVEDPSVDNIGNPSKTLAPETENTCTSCHQPHKGIRATGFDPHFGQDFSCTSCHKIHSRQTNLLIDEEGSFCSGCHVSVVNDFRKRSNHPLTDQALTCLSCHDFTGKNNLNFAHGSNANCYQCHPEQAGPFLHEHEAVSSFGTEGEGCISCHKPHGSINDRLLTQPGDRLCLQCHTPPPLHRTQHDGIATYYDCIECHSDMHGSYTNRMFLDPQLGMKIGGTPEDCFCHNSKN